MSNVKVAVRIRPPNKKEKERNGRNIVQANGNKVYVHDAKSERRPELGDHRDRVKVFVFDHVYLSTDPTSQVYATQDMVFQDLGTEVLQAAFDGYNACVFAYGQTGSGKTHTMMGYPGDLGLIPRICEGLFGHMEDIRDTLEDTDDGRPTTYRIEVSYYEIYNEKVRDLLNRRQAQNENRKCLKVREHPKDGPYVEGLSRHQVKDNERVQALIDMGNTNRTTAATHMHDHSSRSHAIFTLTFIQAKLSEVRPRETRSRINLVDLAGSERADPTSQYNKGRLKEGANINRSLVTLGNVIKALAEKSLLEWPVRQCGSQGSTQSLASTGAPGGTSPASSPKRRTLYIPYRDSVLTYLLRDSLGGNSKTIMIATIAPSNLTYNDTIGTLRYAQRAKNIINKPFINEDPNVKLIRELKAEIARLQNMLVTSHNRRCSTTSCTDNKETQAGSLMSLSEGSSGIVERLEENEMRAHELTQNWITRWHNLQETHEILKESDMSIRPLSRRASSMGVIVDSNSPYLVCMDDDILSTGIVIYYLKEGKTYLGSDEAAFEQDIVLQGEGAAAEHCVIRNSEGEVTLHPCPGVQVLVNNQEVYSTVRLSQGDLVQLGRGNQFRFNNPEEAAKLREHRKSVYGDGRQAGVISRASSMSSLGNSSQEGDSPCATPVSPLHRGPSWNDFCFEIEKHCKTDVERIQHAKKELERVSLLRSQETEAQQEQEEDVWRQWEQHRQQIETEQELLADKENQLRHELQAALAELEAVRTQLSAEQDKFRRMMEEQVRQFLRSSPREESRWQPRPESKEMGIQTMYDFTDLVGEERHTQLLGIADLYGAEIRNLRDSLEGQKKDLLHNELIQDKKHKESMGEITERQKRIDEMFIANTKRIELERKELEEKERHYQQQDSDKLQAINSQREKIERLEQRQRQLIMYIEEKEREKYLPDSERVEPIGESCSEESLASSKGARYTRPTKASLMKKHERPFVDSITLPKVRRYLSPVQVHNVQQPEYNIAETRLSGKVSPRARSPKFKDEKNTTVAQQVTERLYPKKTDSKLQKKTGAAGHMRSQSAPALKADQRMIPVGMIPSAPRLRLSSSSLASVPESLDEHPRTDHDTSITDTAVDFSYDESSRFYDSESLRFSECDSRMRARSASPSLGMTPTFTVGDSDGDQRQRSNTGSRGEGSGEEVRDDTRTTPEGLGERVNASLNEDHVIHIPNKADTFQDHDDYIPVDGYRRKQSPSPGRTQQSPRGSSRGRGRARERNIPGKKDKPEPRPGDSNKATKPSKDSNSSITQTSSPSPQLRGNSKESPRTSQLNRKSSKENGYGPNLGRSSSRESVSSNKSARSLSRGSTSSLRSERSASVASVKSDHLTRKDSISSVDSSSVSQSSSSVRSKTKKSDSSDSSDKKTKHKKSKSEKTSSLDKDKVLSKPKQKKKGNIPVEIFIAGSSGGGGSSMDFGDTVENPMRPHTDPAHELFAKSLRGGSIEKEYRPFTEEIFSASDGSKYIVKRRQGEGRGEQKRSHSFEPALLIGPQGVERTISGESSPSQRSHSVAESLDVDSLESAAMLSRSLPNWPVTHNGQYSDDSLDERQSPEGSKQQDLLSPRSLNNISYSNDSLDDEGKETGGVDERPATSHAQHSLLQNCELLTSSEYQPSQMSVDSLLDTCNRAQELVHSEDRRSPKSDKRKDARRQRQVAAAGDDDAVPHLSDDESLASSGELKGIASRGSSAGKRRRRQPRPNSGSKRSRTNSSEEYITSDNDSVYSEDSLGYSDEKREYSPPVPESVHQMASITENVEAMTSALQQEYDESAAMEVLTEEYSQRNESQENSKDAMNGSTVNLQFNEECQMDRSSTSSSQEPPEDLTMQVDDIVINLDSDSESDYIGSSSGIARLSNDSGSIRWFVTAGMEEDVSKTTIATAVPAEHEASQLATLSQGEPMEEIVAELSVVTTQIPSEEDEQFKDTVMTPQATTEMDVPCLSEEDTTVLTVQDTLLPSEDTNVTPSVTMPTQDSILIPANTVIHPLTDTTAAPSMSTETPFPDTEAALSADAMTSEGGIISDVRTPSHSGDSSVTPSQDVISDTEHRTDPQQHSGASSLQYSKEWSTNHADVESRDVTDDTAVSTADSSYTQALKDTGTLAVHDDADSLVATRDVTAMASLVDGDEAKTKHVHSDMEESGSTTGTGDAGNNKFLVDADNVLLHGPAETSADYLQTESENEHVAIESGSEIKQETFTEMVMIPEDKTADITEKISNDITGADANTDIIYAEKLESMQEDIDSITEINMAPAVAAMSKMTSENNELIPEVNNAKLTPRLKEMRNESQDSEVYNILSPRSDSLLESSESTVSNETVIEVLQDTRDSDDLSGPENDVDEAKSPVHGYAIASPTDSTPTHYSSGVTEEESMTLSTRWSSSDSAIDVVEDSHLSISQTSDYKYEYQQDSGAQSTDDLLSEEAGKYDLQECKTQDTFSRKSIQDPSLLDNIADPVSELNGKNDITDKLTSVGKTDIIDEVFNIGKTDYDVDDVRKVTTDVHAEVLVFHASDASTDTTVPDITLEKADRPHIEITATKQQASVGFKLGNQQNEDSDTLINVANLMHNDKDKPQHNRDSGYYSMPSESGLLSTNSIIDNTDNDVSQNDVFTSQLSAGSPYPVFEGPDLMTLDDLNDIDLQTDDLHTDTQFTMDDVNEISDNLLDEYMKENHDHIDANTLNLNYDNISHENDKVDSCNATNDKDNDNAVDYTDSIDSEVVTLDLQKPIQTEQQSSKANVRSSQDMQSPESAIDHSDLVTSSQTTHVTDTCPTHTALNACTESPLPPDDIITTDTPGLQDDSISCINTTQDVPSVDSSEDRDVFSESIDTLNLWRGWSIDEDSLKLDLTDSASTVGFSELSTPRSYSDSTDVDTSMEVRSAIGHAVGEYALLHRTSEDSMTSDEGHMSYDHILNDDKWFTFHESEESETGYTMDLNSTLQNQPVKPGISPALSVSDESYEEASDDDTPILKNTLVERLKADEKAQSSDDESRKFDYSDSFESDSSDADDDAVQVYEAIADDEEHLIPCDATKEEFISVLTSQPESYDDQSDVTDQTPDTSLSLDISGDTTDRSQESSQRTQEALYAIQESPNSHQESPKSPHKSLESQLTEDESPPLLDEAAETSTDYAQMPPDAELGVTDEPENISEYTENANDNEDTQPIFEVINITYDTQDTNKKTIANEQSSDNELSKDTKTSIISSGDVSRRPDERDNIPDLCEDTGVFVVSSEPADTGGDSEVTSPSVTHPRDNTHDSAPYSPSTASRLQEISMDEGYITINNTTSEFLDTAMDDLSEMHSSELPTDTQDAACGIVDSATVDIMNITEAVSADSVAVRDITSYDIFSIDTVDSVATVDVAKDNVTSVDVTRDNLASVDVKSDSVATIGIASDEIAESVASMNLPDNVASFDFTSDSILYVKPTSGNDASETFDSDATMEGETIGTLDVADRVPIVDVTGSVAISSDRTARLDVADSVATAEFMDDTVTSLNDSIAHLTVSSDSVPDSVTSLNDSIAHLTVSSDSVPDSVTSLNDSIAHLTVSSDSVPDSVTSGDSVPDSVTSVKNTSVASMDNADDILTSHADDSVTKLDLTDDSVTKVDDANDNVPKVDIPSDDVTSLESENSVEVQFHTENIHEVSDLENQVDDIEEQEDSDLVGHEVKDQEEFSDSSSVSPASLHDHRLITSFEDQSAEYTSEADIQLLDDGAAPNAELPATGQLTQPTAKIQSETEDRRTGELTDVFLPDLLITSKPDADKSEHVEKEQPCDVERLELVEQVQPEGLDPSLLEDDLLQPSDILIQNVSDGLPVEDTKAEEFYDAGEFTIVHYKAPEPEDRHDRDAVAGKLERAKDLVQSHMLMLEAADILHQQRQLMDEAYPCLPDECPTLPHIQDVEIGRYVNYPPASGMDDLPFPEYGTTISVTTKVANKNDVRKGDANRQDQDTKHGATTYVVDTGPTSSDVRHSLPIIRRQDFTDSQTYQSLDISLNANLEPGTAYTDGLPRNIKINVTPATGDQGEAEGDYEYSDDFEESSKSSYARSVEEDLEGEASFTQEEDMSNIPNYSTPKHAILEKRLIEIREDLEKISSSNDSSIPEEIISATDESKSPSEYVYEDDFEALSKESSAKSMEESLVIETSDTSSELLGEDMAAESEDLLAQSIYLRQLERVKKINRISSESSLAVEVGDASDNQSIDEELDSFGLANALHSLSGDLNASVNLEDEIDEVPSFDCKDVEEMIDPWMKVKAKTRTDNLQHQQPSSISMIAEMGDEDAEEFSVDAERMTDAEDNDSQHVGFAISEDDLDEQENEDVNVSDYEGLEDTDMIEGDGSERWSHVSLKTEPSQKSVASLVVNVGEQDDEVMSDSEAEQDQDAQDQEIDNIDNHMDDSFADLPVTSVNLTNGHTAHEYTASVDVNVGEQEDLSVITDVENTSAEPEKMAVIESISNPWAAVAYVSSELPEDQVTSNKTSPPSSISVELGSHTAMTSRTSSMESAWSVTPVVGDACDPVMEIDESIKSVDEHISLPSERVNVQTLTGQVDKLLNEVRLERNQLRHGNSEDSPADSPLHTDKGKQLADEAIAENTNESLKIELQTSSRKETGKDKPEKLDTQLRAFLEAHKAQKLQEHAQDMISDAEVNNVSYELVDTAISDEAESIKDVITTLSERKERPQKPADFTDSKVTGFDVNPWEAIVEDNTVEDIPASQQILRGSQSCSNINSGSESNVSGFQVLGLQPVRKTVSADSYIYADDPIPPIDHLKHSALSIEIKPWKMAEGKLSQLEADNVSDKLTTSDEGSSTSSEADSTEITQLDLLETIELESELPQIPESDNVSEKVDTLEEISKEPSEVDSAEATDADFPETTEMESSRGHISTADADAIRSSLQHALDSDREESDQPDFSELIIAVGPDAEDPASFTSDTVDTKEASFNSKSSNDNIRSEMMESTEESETPMIHLPDRDFARTLKFSEVDPRHQNAADEYQRDEDLTDTQELTSEIDGEMLSSREHTTEDDEHYLSTTESEKSYLPREARSASPGEMPEMPLEDLMQQVVAAQNEWLSIHGEYDSSSEHNNYDYQDANVVSDTDRELETSDWSDVNDMIAEISELPDLLVTSEYSSLRETWLNKPSVQQRSLSMTELELIEPRDPYEGKSLSADCLVMLDFQPAKTLSSDSITYVFMSRPLSCDMLDLDSWSLPHRRRSMPGFRRGNSLVEKPRRKSQEDERSVSAECLSNKPLQPYGNHKSYSADASRFMQQPDPYLGREGDIFGPQDDDEVEDTNDEQEDTIDFYAIPYESTRSGQQTPNSLYDDHSVSMGSDSVFESTGHSAHLGSAHGIEDLSAVGVSTDNIPSDIFEEDDQATNCKDKAKKAVSWGHISEKCIGDTTGESAVPTVQVLPASPDDSESHLVDTISHQAGAALYPSNVTARPATDPEEHVTESNKEVSSNAPPRRRSRSLSPTNTDEVTDHLARANLKPKESCSQTGESMEKIQKEVQDESLKQIHNETTHLLQKALQTIQIGMGTQTDGGSTSNVNLQTSPQTEPREVKIGYRNDLSESRSSVAMSNEALATTDSGVFDDSASWAGRSRISEDAVQATSAVSPVQTTTEYKQYPSVKRSSDDSRWSISQQDILSQRTIETQTYPQVRYIETQTSMMTRYIETQTDCEEMLWNLQQIAVQELPVQETFNEPLVCYVDTGISPSPPMSPRDFGSQTDDSLLSLSTSAVQTDTSGAEPKKMTTFGMQVGSPHLSAADMSLSSDDEERKTTRKSKRSKSKSKPQQSNEDTDNETDKISDRQPNTEQHESFTSEEELSQDEAKYVDEQSDSQASAQKNGTESLFDITTVTDTEHKEKQAMHSEVTVTGEDNTKLPVNHVSGIHKFSSFTGSFEEVETSTHQDTPDVALFHYHAADVSESTGSFAAEAVTEHPKASDHQSARTTESSMSYGGSMDRFRAITKTPETVQIATHQDTPEVALDDSQTVNVSGVYELVGEPELELVTEQLNLEDDEQSTNFIESPVNYIPSVDRLSAITRSSEAISRIPMHQETSDMGLDEYQTADASHVYESEVKIVTEQVETHITAESQDTGEAEECTTHSAYHQASADFQKNKLTEESQSHTGMFRASQNLIESVRNQVSRLDHLTYEDEVVESSLDRIEPGVAEIYEPEEGHEGVTVHQDVRDYTSSVFTLGSEGSSVLDVSDSSLSSATPSSSSRITVIKDSRINKETGHSHDTSDSDQCSLPKSDCVTEALSPRTDVSSSLKDECVNVTMDADTPDLYKDKEHENFTEAKDINMLTLNTSEDGRFSTHIIETQDDDQGVYISRLGDVVIDHSVPISDEDADKLRAAVQAGDEDLLAKTIEEINQSLSKPTINANTALIDTTVKKLGPEDQTTKTSSAAYRVSESHCTGRTEQASQENVSSVTLDKEYYTGQPRSYSLSSTTSDLPYGQYIVMPQEREHTVLQKVKSEDHDEIPIYRTSLPVHIESRIREQPTENKVPVTVENPVMEAITYKVYETKEKEVTTIDHSSGASSVKSTARKSSIELSLQPRPPSRNATTQWQDNDVSEKDKFQYTHMNGTDLPVNNSAQGVTSSANTSSSSMKDESIETDFHDRYDDELEQLRRERQRILDMLAKDMMPSKLQVELAEAQLNYIIGQTDTLLSTLDEPSVWDSNWLMQLSDPEQQLSEIGQQHLARYRQTLEASRQQIEQRIQDLEKDRDRMSRSRERSRAMELVKRDAQLQAFKLEREREQITYETGRTVPRSPRSRSDSPDYRASLMNQSPAQPTRYSPAPQSSYATTSQTTYSASATRYSPAPSAVYNSESQNRYSSSRYSSASTTRYNPAPRFSPSASPVRTGAAPFHSTPVSAGHSIPSAASGYSPIPDPPSYSSVMSQRSAEGSGSGSGSHLSRSSLRESRASPNDSMFSSASTYSYDGLTTSHMTPKQRKDYLVGLRKNLISTNGDLRSRSESPAATASAQSKPLPRSFSPMFTYSTFSGPPRTVKAPTKKRHIASLTSSNYSVYSTAYPATDELHRETEERLSLRLYHGRHQDSASDTASISSIISSLDDDSQQLLNEYQEVRGQADQEILKAKESLQKKPSTTSASKPRTSYLERRLELESLKHQFGLHEGGDSNTDREKLDKEEGNCRVDQDEIDSEIEMLKMKYGSSHSTHSVSSRSNLSDLSTDGSAAYPPGGRTSTPLQSDIEDTMRRYQGASGVETSPTRGSALDPSTWNTYLDSGSRHSAAGGSGLSHRTMDRTYSTHSSSYNSSTYQGTSPLSTRQSVAYVRRPLHFTDQHQPNK